MATKVIETNVSFSREGEIPADAQSRVVKVESWGEYVEEVKSQKQVSRHSTDEKLYGFSFPKRATIKYFNANDRRLICIIELFDGYELLKVACVC